MTSVLGPILPARTARDPQQRRLELARGHAGALNTTARTASSHAVKSLRAYDAPIHFD
jgi:ribosomal protein L20